MPALARTPHFKRPAFRESPRWRERMAPGSRPYRSTQLTCQPRAERRRADNPLRSELTWALHSRLLCAHPCACRSDMLSQGIHRRLRRYLTEPHPSKSSDQPSVARSLFPSTRKARSCPPLAPCCLYPLLVSALRGIKQAPVVLAGVFHSLPASPQPAFSP